LAWRFGIALLASAAQVQAHASEASVPTAPAAVVAFNPPVNQPLSIDISDDRLLPDGSRVRFDAHFRLTFMSDGQGWVASLLTLAPGCDGPAHLCQAFNSALQPLSGRERRAYIDRDGIVRPLAGPQSGADLVGDDDIQQAIDTARAGGSDVAAAEIVEVLAYIGMPLAAVGGERIVTVAADHIDIREPMPLSPGPDVSAMTMHKSSRVDRATGLVIASEIDVMGSGNPAPLISHRRWRLHPVDATVP
jgi:hypothetical protein